MKKVIIFLFSLLLSISSFAQNDRYFEVDDIRYRILTEADGSSTFGTVSVAKPEFGSYEGDVVIPNVVKESKNEYADSYKVIEIDDEAFYEAENLRSIKLPPSIEKMGEYVFAKSSVETVTIPIGNLEELGKKAFEYCSNMKEIAIPSTVKTIGEYAFSYCRKLKKVSLNEGLEKIADGAFNECEGLESIEIPNTVRYIGDYAFNFCYRLANIKMGTGVKRIGESCFKFCLRLRNINLPDGLREIGEAAFIRSGIVEIKIPEKIHEISAYCFQNSKIRKVILPSQLSKVRIFAFAYCKMDNINIPKEKQEIYIEQFSQHPRVYSPFVGTTFNANQGQKERENFVKKNSSKLTKISIDYSKIHITGLGITIGNTFYEPIFYPTSNEKYGLLEVVNNPDKETIPDIITITNGPYHEEYIVNGGNVLPHYKEIPVKIEYSE